MEIDWIAFYKEFVETAVSVRTRTGNEIHYGHMNSARTLCGCRAIRPRTIRGTTQSFGKVTCEKCLEQLADYEQKAKG